MVEGLSPNELIRSFFSSAGSVVESRGMGTPRTGRGSADRSPNPVSYLQPIDALQISPAGERLRQQRAGLDSQAFAQSENLSYSSTSTGKPGPTPSSSVSRSPNGKELTAEEEAKVRKLKQRDQEVRRHEQAHKAAAGSAAKGGPSFEFQTGPDGKQYAVGGEVNIDASPVQGNPQATIAKMEQIRRAALAPANPSSQDRAVAAQTRATEQEARAELAKQRRAGGANAPDAATSTSSDSVSGLGGSRGASVSGGSTGTTPALNDQADTRIGVLMDVIA